MEESGKDKEIESTGLSKGMSGATVIEAVTEKVIPGIEGSVASLSGSSAGGIVAARGTIDGVVIRLDGRINKENLFAAVQEFLSTRESFLGGSEVILEWVGAKPEDELSQELAEMLLDKFKITVKSSKLRETPRIDEPSPFTKQRESRLQSLPAESKKAKSLFDGMDIVGGKPSGSGSTSSYGATPLFGSNQSGSMGSSQMGGGQLWDDPDARLIYSTLRSGQKIETDHSLIIFGDVNSGAEIVAGGDIIVLGTLRGVAHAGAYDETGGGRVIFALNLQPTQLRIGMVISRSASDASQKSPEIAKVEDGMIVVEQYSVKNLGRKI